MKQSITYFFPAMKNSLTRRKFLRNSSMAIMALSARPLFAGIYQGNSDTYLEIVRAYADFMIEHGRDKYGSGQSPLFAEGLDRRTLKLLEGEPLKKAQALKFEEWGIRSHDRMLEGANPMHSQNLYQVLYALTASTGEQRYAAEADNSLKFFLNTCQNPLTGLFYWGEHAGWDFKKDAPIAGYVNSNIHEFYRPWVLWDRCWALAPDPSLKFARGLWDHQIANHETGDFSRHAAIDKHRPGTGSPYARHGGFYIETWAYAYSKTQDSIFLKAIETMVDYLEGMRQAGGMMVGGNVRTKASYTERSLTLGVSLWNAAAYLPEPLAVKLRGIARVNDIPANEEPRSVNTESNLWSDGYGSAGGEIAGPANLMMLRYRQLQQESYRKRILAVADVYLKDPVNYSFPIYPGTIGKVIILMLNAHELTGNTKYPDRADYLARKAVELFLPDSVPLPKATHMHEHYEGVTMADSLMMSLLMLWGVRNNPDKQLPLVYCDR